MWYFVCLHNLFLPRGSLVGPYAKGEECGTTIRFPYTIRDSEG